MSAEVALTFDDGPGDVTGTLLDVLGRHRARATFFFLGERVAGCEPEVQRAARDGHEVGVHGWTHDDHRNDPVGHAREAARTADLLETVCGVRPRLFRPPYGYTSPQLEAAMDEHGLRTVLWDVDPRDWEDPGAATVRERTLAGLAPATVVLLHELAGTAEAVDTLLGELEGWRAVTVPELERPPA